MRRCYSPLLPIIPSTTVGIDDTIAFGNLNLSIDIADLATAGQLVLDTAGYDFESDNRYIYYDEELLKLQVITGYTAEVPPYFQKVWRSIGGGTVDIAGKGELAEQPKLDDAFLVQDESASEQKQVLYKNMGTHRIAVNGHLSRPTDDEVTLDIPAISHGKLYRPIKDPLPGHGAAYTWVAVAVTADGTAGFKGVFLRADVINFTPVHGDWCLFGSAQTRVVVLGVQHDRHDRLVQRVLPHQHPPVARVSGQSGGR